MAEAHEELLTFDEFRARVGAAQHRTRAALLALRLQPIRLEADRRQLRYPAPWVVPVREWLRDHDYPSGHDDDDHARGRPSTEEGI